MNAATWIEALHLQPHPEGGYFRETYRATESIPAAALPDRYAAPRQASTAIYFLLESGQFSAFHRVRSDEIWHYYAGSSLTLHLLLPGGGLAQHRLGCDPAAGLLPQRLIPADHWFAATVDTPDSYTLVGCTVAPGFDFADFALAEAGSLAAEWPDHAPLIQRLTHRSTTP